MRDSCVFWADAVLTYANTRQPRLPDDGAHFAASDRSELLPGSLRQSR
jgi:hypothetical protein